MKNFFHIYQLKNQSLPCIKIKDQSSQGWFFLVQILLNLSWSFKKSKKNNANNRNEKRNKVTETSQRKNDKQKRAQHLYKNEKTRNDVIVASNTYLKLYVFRFFCDFPPKFEAKFEAGFEAEFEAKFEAELEAELAAELDSKFSAKNLPNCQLNFCQNVSKFPPTLPP